jgi:hypothetical protein
MVTTIFEQQPLSTKQTRKDTRARYLAAKKLPFSHLNDQTFDEVLGGVGVSQDMTHMARLSKSAIVAVAAPAIVFASRQTTLPLPLRNRSVQLAGGLGLAAFVAYSLQEDEIIDVVTPTVDGIRAATASVARWYTWFRNERVTTEEDRKEIHDHLEATEDEDEIEEDYEVPYERIEPEQRDDESPVDGDENTPAPIVKYNRRRLKARFWTWVLSQTRLRFCTVRPPIRDAATEGAIAKFIQRICEDKGVRPSHVTKIVPWVTELVFVYTKNQLRAQEVATHPEVVARRATYGQRIHHHQSLGEWLTSFVHTSGGREVYRE